MVSRSLLDAVVEAQQKNTSESSNHDRHVQKVELLDSSLASSEEDHYNTSQGQIAGLD